MPLKRVKTFHPHPRLKHIALKKNGTGDGDRGYGGMIVILKEAERFMCKGNDPPSYLNREQTGSI